MTLIKDNINLIVLCLYLLLPFTSRADDSANNYDVVASEFFWGELYPFGGWTLYCGYRFENDRKIEKSKTVTIEHIYPTKSIIEQLNCNSRMECRDTGNSRFARMEADMHNMYPVWHSLVTYRNGSSYGEIEGEHWRVDDCDIEWQGGKLEPRPLARGNIARSMLYMHMEYGLQLAPALIRMLAEWHKNDPPSNQEIDRNNKIESLQGARNSLIDNPALVESLLKNLPD